MNWAYVCQVLGVSFPNPLTIWRIPNPAKHKPNNPRIQCIAKRGRNPANLTNLMIFKSKLEIGVFNPNSRKLAHANDNVKIISSRVLVIAIKTFPIFSFLKTSYEYYTISFRLCGRSISVKDYFVKSVK